MGRFIVGGYQGTFIIIGFLALVIAIALPTLIFADNDNRAGEPYAFTVVLDLTNVGGDRTEVPCRVNDQASEVRCEVDVPGLQFGFTLDLVEDENGRPKCVWVDGHKICGAKLVVIV